MERINETYSEWEELLEETRKKIYAKNYFRNDKWAKMWRAEGIEWAVTILAEEFSLSITLHRFDEMGNSTVASRSSYNRVDKTVKEENAMPGMSDVLKQLGVLFSMGAV